MKRKLLASFAIMSISLCACGKPSTAPVTTPLTTTPGTTAASTPTPTPEATATNTPTNTPEATPQNTPVGETPTQQETLMLSSNIDVKNFKNVKNLTIADSCNADFVLYTSATLKNLTISSITNDAVTCKIDKKLYEVNKFTNTDAVHIKTYIPELHSNLLVTYKTSNDTIVHKLVSFSMKDGNVVLSDIDSKMIQE